MSPAAFLEPRAARARAIHRREHGKQLVIAAIAVGLVASPLIAAEQESASGSRGSTAGSDGTGSGTGRGVGMDQPLGPRNGSGSMESGAGSDSSERLGSSGSRRRDDTSG